jgi:nicotinamidase-related amidase
VATTTAALLVIDVQDRLFAAMPDEVRERLERNVVILVEAARRFRLPVVVTEQYPRGLGHTTPAIAAALATHDVVHRLEKLEFSAPGDPGFPYVRAEWIVTGMEAHICVLQSVRGLLGRGAAVEVVADAVSSRTKQNWRIGLDLAARAGAAITSTETVVFELLGKAGTEDFKAMSRLIK